MTPVEERLHEFVSRIEKLCAKYQRDTFPGLKPAKFSIDMGRKYARVVRFDGSQHMVHCFVDLASGDVLKAESWRKPAKHARSNVNDEDYGISGVNAYGANYLVGPKNIGGLRT